MSRLLGARRTSVIILVAGLATLAATTWAALTPGGLGAFQRVEVQDATGDALLLVEERLPVLDRHGLLDRLVRTKRLDTPLLATAPRARARG